MMQRQRFLVAAVAILLPYALPCAAQTQNAAAHVYSDAGNVYIARNGAKTKLTQSEMDVDPVLAPNGDYVVFTRQGRGRTVHGYDSSQVCSTQPRPDELRRINVDGSGDKLLLKGRKGGAEHQLCDFRQKQFSSDGRRLYFLTPGWATSGALHVFDTVSGDDRFVTPANDVLVLSFCPNKYKDDLVVLAHRTFLLGGSYDWYWLYDSSGKKELGPLGELADRDALLKIARDEWCR